MVNFQPYCESISRVSRWNRLNRKFRFSRIYKRISRKKLHSISNLTWGYLYAKIERISIFEPCRKKIIFVWFLRGGPLKVLSRKLQEEVTVSQLILIVFKCIVLELVALRGKKLFGPRPQNIILVPFRGSFKIFTITRVTSMWGSPRDSHTCSRN